MGLDSLVLDPKPDPGSTQPDGDVADVLRFGHQQGQSGVRARRLGLISCRWSGRRCARAQWLGSPSARALFDREDERRRVELEDGRPRTPVGGGRPEERLIERSGMGSVVDAQRNELLWQPHDQPPARTRRANRGAETQATHPSAPSSHRFEAQKRRRPPRVYPGGLRAIALKTPPRGGPPRPKSALPARAPTSPTRNGYSSR
jgi:hypothetical protein